MEVIALHFRILADVYQPERRRVTIDEFGEPISKSHRPAKEFEELADAVAFIREKRLPFHACPVLFDKGQMIDSNEIRREAAIALLYSEFYPGHKSIKKCAAMIKLRGENDIDDLRVWEAALIILDLRPTSLLCDQECETSEQ